MNRRLIYILVYAALVWCLLIGIWYAAKPWTAACAASRAGFRSPIWAFCFSMSCRNSSICIG